MRFFVLLVLMVSDTALATLETFSEDAGFTCGETFITVRSMSDRSFVNGALITVKKSSVHMVYQLPKHDIAIMYVDNPFLGLIGTLSKQEIDEQEKKGIDVRLDARRWVVECLN